MSIILPTGNLLNNLIFNEDSEEHINRAIESALKMKKIWKVVPSASSIQVDNTSTYTEESHYNSSYVDTTPPSDNSPNEQVDSDSEDQYQSKIIHQIETMDVSLSNLQDYYELRVNLVINEKTKKNHIRKSIFETLHLLKTKTIDTLFITFDENVSLDKIQKCWKELEKLVSVDKVIKRIGVAHMPLSTLQQWFSTYGTSIDMIPFANQLYRSGSYVFDDLKELIEYCEKYKMELLSGPPRYTMTTNKVNQFQKEVKNIEQNEWMIKYYLISKKQSLITNHGFIFSFKST